jgi:hypothetical protein
MKILVRETRATGYEEILKEYTFEELRELFPQHERSTLSEVLNFVGELEALVKEAQDDGVNRIVSWDDWMDRAEQLTGYDPKSK